MESFVIADVSQGQNESREKSFVLERLLDGLL
jgi:hypothetical protein